MRIHRLTHPVLGPVSWVELQKYVRELRRRENRKACWWCFGAVPSGCRTRCASPQCERQLNDLVYPGRLHRRVLREAKFKCAICLVGWAAETDHIIPVVRGGTGDRDNLRALCTMCHKKETAELARKRAIERKLERNLKSK